MKRKVHHPAEFRAEAVRLVAESGRRVPEIAADLGVSSRTLERWVEQARLKPEGTTGKEGLDQALAAEVKQLRRELEMVRQERDILKKAIGVFSRENR